MIVSFFYCHYCKNIHIYSEKITLLIYTETHCLFICMETININSERIITLQWHVFIFVKD